MNWECCDLIGAKITDTFARVEEGFRISDCGLRIEEGIEHGAWGMGHGVKGDVNKELITVND